MKKRTFLAVFLLVLVAAVVGGLNAWALSAPAERGVPIATVTVDEGEAFLRHGAGSWEPVAADAALAEGDQVKTNIKSQATINFFDGATARLDEDSEVVIRELTMDADNHASSRVTLAVTAGRVWSRVVKILDRDATYSVQSSTVVATVRGTTFVADVSSPDGDAMQVADGLVRVARAPNTPTEPAWEDVRSGEEAWMPKKGGVAAADKLVRRAMAERFRSSAWFRKNQAADEVFLNYVKQQRERILSGAARTLPGTPHHALQGFGERLRLALTTDSDARRNLRMAYEDRRFAETVLLARAGKTDAAMRSWSRYLDGFRAMQREIGVGKMEQKKTRTIIKQMVGRMAEHRMLIAALNGEGVQVPDTLRDRIMGERSEMGDMLSALQVMDPDAFGTAVPVRFRPLDAPRVDTATTTEPTVIDDTKNLPTTNTNTNTNKPVNTNTNVPTNTNTNIPVTGPTAQSLAVIGTRTLMNIPDSQQFRAMLSMSDGSTSDVTVDAQWELVGDAIGTLARGYLTTAALGSASVHATYAGFTGSYNIRTIQQAPTQATLQSVTVSPASASLKNGQQQAFSATASYSDGSTRDVTAQAAWSQSNPAAGTLTGNVFVVSYQFQAQATTITARYTDGITVSGTANVSVGP
ncbi:MAG: FecR domain-containing protein [Patescibacteria group bacterium]